MPLTGIGAQNPNPNHLKNPCQMVLNKDKAPDKSLSGVFFMMSMLLSLSYLPRLTG